ncbi:hypothetical protein GE09DRAFT_1180896 [Coniochaeta sp. 2T2.1]|nr:hypothetical protein GE09DRAFT_1180896 [Coniochaeta sp. 2T2.1]
MNVEGGYHLSGQGNAPFPLWEHIYRIKAWILKLSPELDKATDPNYAPMTPYKDVTGPVTQINHAVTHDFGVLFSLIPGDLETYRTVFRTLDTLGVDVLRGGGIHYVAARIDVCVRRWTRLPFPYRYQERMSIIADADSAAFLLLTMIMTGQIQAKYVANPDFVEEHRANPAFSPVRMILSNTGIWSQSIQRLVLGAYQDKFGYSWELAQCHDHALTQHRMLAGAEEDWERTDDLRSVDPPSSGWSLY